MVVSKQGQQAQHFFPIDHPPESPSQLSAPEMAIGIVQPSTEPLTMDQDTNADDLTPTSSDAESEAALERARWIKEKARDIKYDWVNEDDLLVFEKVSYCPFNRGGTVWGRGGAGDES